MLVLLILVEIAASFATHTHHLSVYASSNECSCSSHKLKNLKTKQSRKNKKPREKKKKEKRKKESKKGKEKKKKRMKEDTFISFV